MRVIHLQIFAALLSVGFVGAGAGVMVVHAGKQEAERKLEKAERELRALRGVNPLAVRPRADRDLEQESRDLAARARTLERKVRDLEAENAMLKQSLALASQERPAAHKPVPGAGATPAGPSPLPVVEARPADPVVPPPPEPPYNEAWGASEDGELDEIASVLKLTPEQRAQTREFIIAAQNDFIKALSEAGAAGEKDITIIERIGEQFSRRTKEQIRGILRPEQYAAFDDLMRQKEEMR